MRTIVKLAYAAGTLVMVGCGRGETAMNDELRKDLELAWSSDAITLAGSDAKAAEQVVSAVERDALGPRKVAPSQRVAKHRPAPRKPARVAVAEPDMAEEVETVPAAVAPQPVEPEPVMTASLPSPRPRPMGGPDDVGVDRGEGDGIGIDRGRVFGGAIRVILRGGGVDGDNCELHDGRGRRMGGRMGGAAVIAINNRIPIQGTFPGRSRF